MKENIKKIKRKSRKNKKSNGGMEENKIEIKTRREWKDNDEEIIIIE